MRRPNTQRACFPLFGFDEAFAFQRLQVTSGSPVTFVSESRCDFTERRRWPPGKRFLSEESASASRRLSPDKRGYFGGTKRTEIDSSSPEAFAEASLDMPRGVA